METKDLFNIERFITPRGILNERAGLNKWFADTFGKDGKMIALRTAHIEAIGDLYALKSQVADRLQRNGIESARKYFFWITKTHAVHDEHTAKTP